MIKIPDLKQRIKPSDNVKRSYSTTANCFTTRITISAMSYSY